MGAEQGGARELGTLFLEAALRAVRRHRATLKGAQDFQDAVNEVARRLVPYATRVSDVAQITGLALKIARNLEVDRIRKDAQGMDLAYSEELLGRLADPAPEQALRPRDPQLVTELARILSNLPRDGQTVFRLRVLDGLTYDQIATSLSIPESTVRRHFREAVHTVRVCLETRMADDPSLKAAIIALGFRRR